MNPKEWLENHCPLKNNAGHKCVTANQRGRLSQEHHDILAKNEKAISGYRPKEVENKKGEARIVNEAARAGTKTIVSEIAYTFPEKEYQAFAMVDGKRIDVGMRECCSNCYAVHGIHVSLTAHTCLEPSVSTVLAQEPRPVKVIIEKRTRPLPSNRW